MDRVVLKFSKRLYRKKAKATTDNYCAYFNFWLILLACSVQLSALPSRWAALGLAISWGRKPVLLGGSILVFVGSLLASWFPNDVVEIIGLTIIGCGVGFLDQVIPVVLDDMNIGDTRGRMSFIFNYMLICGSTVAAGVNLAAATYDFRNGWRGSFALCGVLVIPVGLVSALLNETPQFLIKKRRMEEAQNVLMRLRQSGARAELHRLEQMIGNEDKNPYRKLRQSPVMVINVVAQFFQKVIAYDSIIFFGPWFLESVGYMGGAAFLSPFFASAVRFVVAGFTLPCYNIFGRRRMLISSCIVMVLSLISLFGVLLVRADLLFHLDQQSSHAAIAFAIIFIFSYTMFSGPCGWTEASYAEEAREVGSCLEGTVSLFMALAMNIAILSSVCALKAWFFLFLVVLVLFVAFLIYKFLPEIGKKDGELPENDIWRGHSFWKRLLPKDDNADGL